MTQKIQNVVNSWLWKIISPVFFIIVCSLVGFIVTQGVKTVEAIAQESKVTVRETLNNKASIKAVYDKVEQDRENHKALRKRVDGLQQEQIKSNTRFWKTLHKIELHIQKIDDKIDNLKK